MRKFLITNESSFKGVIEVSYTDEGVFLLLDTRNAELSETQIAYILNKHIPVYCCNLKASDFGKEAMIVEEGYIVAFEDFWQKYPRKVNKLRCQKIWEKLTTDKKSKAVEGIKKYMFYLKNHPSMECKLPDTYLRGENWGDEYE